MQQFVRRWYLTLAGLLGTIGLCALAAILVPAKYTATADILLVPPAVTTGPAANPNPYLSLGGLQPFADVVASNMNDGTSLATLRSAGLTSTYTVVPDANTNGPLLIVTTMGATPAATLKDLNAVLALAPVRVNQLQTARSIASSTLISVETVANVTKATPNRKTQLRAVIVAGAVGIVVSALGIGAIDWMLRRRTARKAVTADVQTASLQGDPPVTGASEATADEDSAEIVDVPLVAESADDVETAPAVQVIETDGVTASYNDLTADEDDADLVIPDSTERDDDKNDDSEVIGDAGAWFEVEPSASSDAANVTPGEAEDPEMAPIDGEEHSNTEVDEALVDQRPRVSTVISRSFTEIASQADRRQRSQPGNRARRQSQRARSISYPAPPG